MQPASGCTGERPGPALQGVLDLPVKAVLATRTTNERARYDCWMPKSDHQDDAMLCRLYDADRLMKLLKKDEETILPPEFHKPLNLEYKVCHKHTLNIQPAPSLTAALTLTSRSACLS